MIRRALLLPALLLGSASGALAQAGGGPENGQCVFSLDFVGGLGTQTETPSGTNHFAGGGVRMSCAGIKVSMESDSVAAYASGGRAARTVVFVGHVKYRDSTVTMTADRGIYYKEGERWEARGNVVTENLQNGSTLRGPALDYYRALKGARDTTELYAVGRPTIRYYTDQKGGKQSEPYVIVAERVRMKGNDRVWGGGKVTVDRSDFSARGDSLRLDTGAGSDGSLMVGPVLKGLGTDTFTLTGRRIDLKLDHQELTYVTAKGDAHAVNPSVDLKADTIGLDINDDKLVQTLAWGDSVRPFAIADEYAIRADSLALDTPKQQLTETRAFGRAWVGSKVDSTTQERDWLAGDTVIARFAERQSGGNRSNELARVDAARNARSFYRVTNKDNPKQPSLNYSRGDHITVYMKESGSSGVARVELRGSVDGVQLEPLKPDSAAKDSTAAADSTRTGGSP